MGRGGRPASSLGLLSPDGGRTNHAADDGEGEWVTVVSKFHFVDLAGSERVRVSLYLNAGITYHDHLRSKAQAHCGRWGAH